ncbi:preprotein translocase subunit SecE [Candidatus Azambacteria bacterium]|nr:preprotein translocase subunit SecE [Candidatus Azambacteria bacterium]
MNILSRIYFGFINYSKEVQSELKKVTWPSKEMTIKYTLAVVALSFAMVVFLGGLDLVFSYLLNKYIL